MFFPALFDFPLFSLKGSFRLFHLYDKGLANSVALGTHQQVATAQVGDYSHAIATKIPIADKAYSRFIPRKKFRDLVFLVAIAGIIYFCKRSRFGYFMPHRFSSGRIFVSSHSTIRTVSGAGQMRDRQRLPHNSPNVGEFTA